MRYARFPSAFFPASAVSILFRGVPAHEPVDAVVLPVVALAIYSGVAPSLRATAQFLSRAVTHNFAALAGDLDLWVANSTSVVNS